MAKSISDLISGKPYSQAKISGKPIAPKINGTVKFYPWAQGTVVKAEIVNLPLQRLAMGDMPVLFSNNGYAFMVFYTNRFTPAEAIGKTVIIHQNPDDFRSQPSGNSGEIIACGEVVRAN